MRKNIFILLLLIWVFISISAQKTSTYTKQTVDFEVINKSLQITYSGKSGSDKEDNLQRQYIIRIKCLSPNITVDSIYYNGYVIANAYENPLPQGDDLLYIFYPTAQNGTRKPFVINCPKDIIFRYKKNGKTKYLSIKDIPIHIHQNG